MSLRSFGLGLVGLCMLACLVGISASVRVWKFPVLLITIGITSTCILPLLCSCMACLSGS